MESSSFAHRLAISAAMPRLAVGSGPEINIGFLAPLSGQAESWGQPGLQGCRIWQDWLNRAGGLLLAGRRHPIRIRAYDSAATPQAAREGAKSLVQDHDVQLLMMLGGDSFAEVADYLSQRRVLTSTLLPSDLSPDTRYLIAPSEVHPVYVVTGVDWLTRTRPELRRVAMCSQRDAMGLPSLATYRAAFKAAGRDIVKEVQYPAEGADAQEIVAAMLADGPDILCWCTSYTPMVHALTEAAQAAGFTGQILSCTFDQYEILAQKLGQSYLEGLVFQFPDFDDSALSEKAFFFNQPNAFYEEFNARYPGSWSAVSWEYAAILDIWHAAVEKAGTTNARSVLAAMKRLGHVTHPFGPAQWWGSELFGIDNALVGDWPVVMIRDGKAQIVSFESVPAWLGRHSALLRSEMYDLGQMWDQRMGQTGPMLGARAP